MDGTAIYAGVDVSEDQLDLAFSSRSELWNLSNDEAGIQKPVHQLTQVAPALVVLEATGGFETPAVAALVHAGLSAIVVNPRQVRDIAEATGQLAKMDRLDAPAPSRLAEWVDPEVRLLGEEAARSRQGQ